MMLPRLALFIAAIGILVVNAAIPDPTSLWTLGDLDYTDELYAGFDQIQGVEYMRIYDGSEVGRTYSHHAIVEGVGERLFAAHSSAANDEDSMGQQVWLSTATQVHGSWKWGSPIIAIGSAMLPNQTVVGDRNFTFWCSQSVCSILQVAIVKTYTAQVTQRALQPAAIVQYAGSVYLIAETADISCNNGTRIATRGAGRLAVRFSTSGKQLSKACWLVQNQVTKDDLYAQTPVGATMCAPPLVHGLGVLLNRPDTLPFTNSLLINSPKFVGSDGSSPMIEVTKAVWNHKGRYWQRHWRDSSSKTTYVSNFVSIRSELTKNLAPVTGSLTSLTQMGRTQGFCPSNIPDSNTKSFYGALPDGRTYLVSNLMYHATGARAKQRQPLCISIASDGVHIDWAGVFHTNASTVIVPDSRAIKRVGFSYPHATIIGDYMYVGYSEDKEDIVIAKVPLKSLGKTNHGGW
ncbi:hypothetical protein DL96DRAFT_1703596 [Flagelloscypha sp. PMI_526]|nr:hypothetical protein DL96DRAFT_1703596 [Flagelloscypha sp. PMI_526]